MTADNFRMEYAGTGTYEPLLDEIIKHADAINDTMQLFLTKRAKDATNQSRLFDIIRHMEKGYLGRIHDFQSISWDLSIPKLTEFTDQLKTAAYGIDTPVPIRRHDTREADN
jgi:hypothetical protein